MQYSETFNNIFWNPVNNTVTANTTSAPNGTSTADTFTLSASSDASIYAVISGVSNNYTISVYAKYVSGGQYLYFYSPLNSQGVKVWFDIQNGTVSNQLSGFTGNIENAGNGWYKCSIYNTTPLILTDIQFGISTTNSSRVLSNNSVSYFWGAQVNLGTAKPYFPTTDRLNVPRLTYQNGGGGCPSLLLEKQSTNYAQYSEQFDNAWWTKTNATITANNAVSPDGSSNADLLTYTTSAGFIVSSQYFGSATTATSVSLFVKAGTSNLFSLGITDNILEGFYYTFNLATQTATLTIAPAFFTSPSFKIENYGNGWYRLVVSAVSTVNGRISLFAPSVAGLTANYNIWGAQIEVSSYPTSYIPTTSASATRVADACYKTGISSLIGQTEGTIFADFLTSGLPSIDQYFMNLSDGSTSNIIYIGFYSNILVARIIDAGSLLVNINVGLATNTRYKVGFAYKSNDCVLYINGSNSGSDTSTTIPATSKLSYNDFSNEACYQLNESVLFKTRLTNAELASLTTI